jgi:hypothetical protein
MCSSQVSHEELLRAKVHGQGIAMKAGYWGPQLHPSVARDDASMQINARPGEYNFMDMSFFPGPEQMQSHLVLGSRCMAFAAAAFEASRATSSVTVITSPTGCCWTSASRHIRAHMRLTAHSSP